MCNDEHIGRYVAWSYIWEKQFIFVVWSIVSVTVVGRANWRLDNLSKSGKSSSENDQKRSETKIDIFLTLDTKLQYSGQMTEKLRRLIFHDTV